MARHLKEHAWVKQSGVECSTLTMGQVNKRGGPKDNCGVQAPARQWELEFLIAGLCSDLDAASKWDHFDD